MEADIIAKDTAQYFIDSNTKPDKHQALPSQKLAWNFQLLCNTMFTQEVSDHIGKTKANSLGELVEELTEAPRREATKD